MTTASRIRAGHLLLPALLFALAGLTSAQPPKKDGISLTLLGGENIAAKTLAISGGKVSGEGIESPIPLDDLRQIRLAPPSSEGKPGVVLHLLGGGKILAKSLTVASDECL